MYRRSLVFATCVLLFALALGPIGARQAGADTVSSLTIAELGAPDTLDPLLTRTTAGADATAGVFDTLVRLDDKGVFQPDLALSWHHTVDARTWTFTLDPRARWQDGEPVTADDVAFTIRLVRDARFGATSTVGFDGITGITVGDTHTLTVTLRASYGPFLATVGTTPILPSHILKGLSPAAIRDNAAFNRRPIGSGPFTVAAVGLDGRVVEEANPDYFQGAPHLDRLVFAPMASRRDALSAARHGGVLLPPALGLSANDVAGLSHARGLRTVYTPSFAWTHLDLIEHGALKDVRVRRALALATPRDVLVARVLRGHGRIGDGDQAPGTAAYAPGLHSSYHYDPLKARSLLKDAGYGPLPSKSAKPKGKKGKGKGGNDNPLVGRDGKPLVITLWGDASCATCVQTLKLIAQGWRTAGVTGRIRLVPTKTLFGAHGPLYNPDRFTTSEYDAVLYTWVNGPDPDDSFYWKSDQRVTPAHPLGGNFIGYDNAALDALITRAVVMPDGPGRDALYRQIQRILTADEPDVFLYWADTVSVAPTGLRGYDPTPYNSAATWNVQGWALRG